MVTRPEWSEVCRWIEERDRGSADAERSVRPGEVQRTETAEEGGAGRKPMSDCQINPWTTAGPSDEATEF